ncbi:MAG: CinA family protein [Robiginitomaculum sp.]|nr:CinA family protein [Robiginitomaculum sp.]
MTDEIYKRAEQIIKTAREKRLTIATAESCTGGGIGAALTAIPGSSAVFEGGIISYSNAVKGTHLGVPPSIIKKHGAVSGQVARLMAEHVRSSMDTDLAVSVTGIAGPTGGSKNKPVGTVWIGLAVKGEDTQVQHFLFANDGRENVRGATIVAALELLRRKTRQG